MYVQGGGGLSAVVCVVLESRVGRMEGVLVSEFRIRRDRVGVGSYRTSPDIHRTTIDKIRLLVKSIKGREMN